MTGRDSEKVIEATFPVYADAGIARLMAMPVPTAPVGVHPKTKRPIFALKGKAPFDIVGYLTAHPGHGLFIGGEVKSTTARKQSLSIVGPGKSGDGIQFHQLEALALLAEAGGVARIIWSNAGQWAVATEAVITNAFMIYEQAMATEQAGNTPPQGAKSIPWSAFAMTSFFFYAGHSPVVNWLQATEAGAVPGFS